MKNFTITIFLAAMLLPSVASAQVASNKPLYQSGTVTPGHVAMFATSGVLMDGGAAKGGAPGTTPNTLNITGPNNPFCINDVPTTSLTGYHQICIGFGANPSSQFEFSMNSYAGASNLPCTFIVNGNPFPCLGSTSGTPFTASKDSLAALPISYSAAVIRLDYITGNGAPPLLYIASNSPCSLNSGAGDGGSQVPSLDGKCWIGQFDGPANIMEWGAKPEGPGPSFPSVPIDPAGTFDSTIAINTALASGLNLLIPQGWFHVTDRLTCSGYGQSILGVGRAQSVIDVGSDFNLSASSVLALAPPTGTNPNFQTECSLRKVGLQFYQNASDTLRSQLIHYPYAISGVNGAAQILDEVRISRCWDGINMTGNDGLFWWGRLELACFDQNVHIDGELGYSHADSIFVSPNFGAQYTNLLNIWKDGNTQAMYVNYIDGLDISKLSTFYASIDFGPNNQLVTGDTIGILDLNGDGSTVKVEAGSVSIGAWTASSNGTFGPQLVVNDTVAPNPNNARVNIGTFRQAGQQGPAVAQIEVTAGTLVINGGIFNEGENQTGFIVDGTNGYLIMNNVNLVFPATMNRTVPIIKDTLGYGLSLHNVSFQKTGGVLSGPLLEIDVDNLNNDVGNLPLLSQWGTPGIVFGFALDNPLGLNGKYQFDVLFPITSTPMFTTNGDFSPVNNTVSGYFQLNGSTVNLLLNDKWSNNAFTTPSGPLFFQTNAPSAQGSGSMGTACATSLMDNVTIGAGQFPGSSTINGTSEVSPQLFNSAGVTSGVTPTNIPASRTNINFSISCTYPIR